MIDLKNALTFLTDRPSIGMAGGFGSGLLLSVQSFVTDEHALKIAASLGVVFGMLVAALTLILKCIELVEKVHSKIKRKS
ncbi:hypothetical protein SAMN05421827_109142 [Pedobacter terrae]|uniref:Uncharacterized protein n=1 Tax=Pedobacter terrae TaxID=405671 RepID=A0A1G7W827_9SPHI|nr:hypothetical protein [Pedobacter terrae]SDG68144.1 hypothetical protein SAMN05421827_109142 [Pedobacter terrae]